MDLYDDIFNDQLLQFSPLCLSPPPEPFTPLMEFLRDPIMEETENVGEVTVGLTPNPPISEANRSTGTHSPNLIPLPETLTLAQNPPEMEQQQLLYGSHGYLQETLPNEQLDQHSVLDQIMLDYFQEPGVNAMQQHQQVLCNSDGHLQGNLTDGQLDQQSLLNQIIMSCFQQPSDSTMQQEQLVCNSHGVLQGNLPNGQRDHEQSLFNQNMMGSVQQPNDSTMSDIGQQIEEENSRYAHPTMTQSFELPNDLQEQFLSVPLSQSYSSYPTYQHGPVASHFNMYDQQHLPLVLANSEERPLVPRMITDVARTPPLPQMPSSSTRNQENVQEQVNQDLPRFSYPTLDTYAQALPCTNSLSSIQINVLKGRERSYQSHIEYGESSSSAQRRRNILPKRNVDSSAANPGQERLQNSLYDIRYKSLGLAMDPHLRKFSRLPVKKVIGQ